MWVWLLLGLSVNSSAQKNMKGSDVIVGNGIARVVIEFNKSPLPTAIGIEMTGSALIGLPHQDQEYILPLPAKTVVAPYKHVTLNWNPHGHFPDDVYGVPHFDYHFYFISEKDRSTIICKNGGKGDPCTKMPLEKRTPPFYVPAPEGVSKMGWHWVDSRSPELNGHPFTTTFIYGYYKGDLIFIEPMIAQTYLLTKPQFRQDIETPPTVKGAGFYPKSYSVTFDSAQDLLTVKMEKLGLRGATADF